MSDPSFAQFYPQSAAFEPAAYHKVDSAAAPPTISLDNGENQKQSFDFFNYSQAGLDVVAPHPDQFELELDNSLAAFDAELSLIPIDTADFSFYRSATPTFGPPSSFTVSSESVSGYDSVYNDSISSRSESYYNFNPNAQGQSPTPNFTPSVYSLTQEQLDMEFQRMAMPTEDPNSFGALPSSPSIRSSPGSVPNISSYSPGYSSRGSFSDYDPQPQQVRLSSSASDYYPQAQVQINKYANGGRVVHQAPQARSTASVSPQLSALSHPSGVSHPSLTAQRAKMDSMHDDPKRKYQCPTCPRGKFV